MSSTNVSDHDAHAHTQLAPPTTPAPVHHAFTTSTTRKPLPPLPEYQSTPTPPTIIEPTHRSTTTPDSIDHHGPAAPEPTGAAQFITNLSERQKAHLQFAVPSNASSDRLSHFLDEPRQVPVPNRFTFDALDSVARKARDSSSTGGKSSKLGRGESTKSGKTSNSSHSRHGSGSDKGSDGTRTRSRSRATSLGESFRTSVDLFKEVEHLKDVVVEVVDFDAEDWRFYATGVCLCLVNLVMAWDATAISIALPTIATALHGSAIESFWLGIAFLVGAVAFLPMFSAFSEIFGRKAMLLTGLSCFTIGSFIAAVSGNLGGLHLGRSVQGIGAGGIFVLSDLIVTDLVSPLDKRRWSAILGAMWAIGAVSGPAIGEALAESSQWRLIFWLNLPFCLASFLVIPFCAKLKAATPGSMIVKLRNFDWVGFFLFAGSLVGLLLGISWGGTLHTWSNPNTLLPIQFGLIGIVIFCVWSWFSPFPSLISLDGFRDRTSLATYFGTMIQGTIICGFLYFMPFYFSVAKLDLSHLAAGVRWFPWTLPLVFFILITFIAVSRWNTWLPAIWLGWVLVLLGVALTTVYARTSPKGTWVGIAIVLGSGVGILYPSLHTASELIAAQVGDEALVRRSVTNFTFFQLLGKALGVAIGTSIFENQLFKNLENNPTFKDYAREYTGDAVALVIRVRATHDGPAKMQIADIYVDSLRTIWTFMAVLAGLALLVSCFMMPKDDKPSKDVEMKNLDRSYLV